MRVPIFKRLLEARDNPNADLHKLTTEILALLGVVGQSEQLKADDEPIVKGEQYVAEYVSKHGKDLTSL